MNVEGPQTYPDEISYENLKKLAPFSNENSRKIEKKLSRKLPLSVKIIKLYREMIFEEGPFSDLTKKLKVSKIRKRI